MSGRRGSTLRQIVYESDPLLSSTEISDATSRIEDLYAPLVEEVERLRNAGKRLARLTGELNAMEIDHAEIRKEQKTERDKLRSDILGLAETIRQQGR